MWTTFRALLAGALRDRISLFYATLFPAALLLALGYFYPDPAYRQQLLIGMLALGTVSFAMMGTGFEVMRQRSRGVYKLLRATPFRTPNFVSALTAARGIITLICTVLVLAVGLIAFGLKLSLAGALLLVPVLALGILCFTCLGFTVGNLAGNEAQVAMLNNLTMWPMMFASEMFYSLARAPEWIRLISKALPLSPFLDAMQAAWAGNLSGMALPMLLLLGWTAAGLALAVVTFRWDPDARVRLSAVQHP